MVLQEKWKKFSLADGRVYFGNQETQQSSWTRPLVTEFQAGNGADGVQQLHHTCSGSEFLFVFLTNGFVSQFNNNGELLNQFDLRCKGIDQPIWQSGCVVESLRTTWICSIWRVEAGKASFLSILELNQPESAAKFFRISNSSLFDEKLSTSFDGYLYTSGEQGVINMWILDDLLKQEVGSEVQPTKQILIGQNTVNTSPFAQKVRLYGTEISCIKVFSNVICTVDRVGTIRCFRNDKPCFPLSGTPTGKRNEGSVNDIIVHNQMLYVPRNTKIYAFRFADLSSQVAGVVGVNGPRPVGILQLDEFLTTTVFSITATDRLIFTGQSDGTIAVWNPVSGDEAGEWVYEVDDDYGSSYKSDTVTVYEAEEHSVSEQFSSFSHPVLVYGFSNCLWSATNQQNHIKVWCGA